MSLTLFDVDVTAFGPPRLTSFLPSPSVTTAQFDTSLKVFDVFLNYGTYLSSDISKGRRDPLHTGMRVVLTRAEEFMPLHVAQFHLRRDAVEARPSPAVNEDSETSPAKIRDDADKLGRAPAFVVPINGARLL